MAIKKAINGRQKAAHLLISLGPEKSAKIFRHLKDDELEQITLEIANVRKTTSEQLEEIMREFYELCLANRYIQQGGSLCSGSTGKGIGS